MIKIRNVNFAQVYFQRFSPLLFGILFHVIISESIEKNHWFIITIVGQRLNVTTSSNFSPNATCTYLTGIIILRCTKKPSDYKNDSQKETELKNNNSKIPFSTKTDQNGAHVVPRNISLHTRGRQSHYTVGWNNAKLRTTLRECLFHDYCNENVCSVITVSH